VSSVGPRVQVASKSYKADKADTRVGIHNNPSSSDVEDHRLSTVLRVSTSYQAGYPTMAGDPTETQAQPQPNKLVTIDGRTGEGGGQLCRIAVSLAALTGTPLRIDNVRGNR
jgi:hypothetical protein